MQNPFHVCSALALVAGIFASPALAQIPTCGVKNHMRLVNRVNDSAVSELRIDTGWLSIASGTSLDTPGNSTASGQLGYSSGSWLASSTYGRLTFSGSANGHNAPGNGIFLWIDEWIGGEPKAWFRDRFTVVSGSLPPGTPVTIRAVTSLTGSATCSDPNADLSFGASFTDSSALNVSYNKTTGQQTHDIVVPVGQSRDLSGRLYCTIRDNRILGGTVYSDTLQADLYANISFAVLTPGASLQFCSGALFAPCKGDLNSDGFVDDSDFTLFVGAYNVLDCADPAMPVGCPADLNGDGFVDDADFIIFVAAYNALLCP